MTHDSINAQLSDYLDEELDHAARRDVEAHLAACEACRSTLRDLAAITRAASMLPAAPPAEDLWPGVSARIGADDRVRLFRPGTAARRVSFSLPQLAAAGIALMLLSGGLVYLTLGVRGGPTTGLEGDVAQVAAPDATPVSLADPQFDQAIADLEEALAEGRARLDPETVRVLEQNLEAIDLAIRQCRQALEADPANAYLTRHLASARQHKLALLRRATALTAGSS